MRNTAILTVKFIICLIAFAVSLDLFFNATYVDIISFSLFVSIVSFVLGDKVILPQLGAKAAAITDFLLVYMSVWLFGNVLLNNYLQIAWGSIFSAMIITSAEVLLHYYIIAHDNSRQKTESLFNGNLAYSAEFSKEQNISIEDEED